MQRVLTAAAQIVTSNSLGFRGTFNGKYDFVVVDVHPMTNSYFVVHKTLCSELKIYHVIVTCLNRLCSARYRIISVICFYLVMS